MNLYQQLKEASCEMDNHESDLYVVVTPESRRIVEAYKGEPYATCTVFHSQVDGRKWYEIPFAYSPWWEQREKDYAESIGDPKP